MTVSILKSHSEDERLVMEHRDYFTRGKHIVSVFIWFFFISSIWYFSVWVNGVNPFRQFNLLGEIICLILAVIVEQIVSMRVLTASLENKKKSQLFVNQVLKQNKDLMLIIDQQNDAMKSFKDMVDEKDLLVGVIMESQNEIMERQYEIIENNIINEDFQY